MPDKIFITTLALDFVFLASGAIEMGFSISGLNLMLKGPGTGKQATRSLLDQEFPLVVAIFNASLIIASFVLTIPGLLSRKRKILKIGGHMIMFSGFFTLVVGIYLWLMTLRLKESLAPIYAVQDPAIQSMVQASFNCCGYLNFTSPAFVTDVTCPSPAAAALLPGCATSMSNYANAFIDQVFTALFGMVGVDALLIVAITCLLKARKENERYRLIDQKLDYYNVL